MARFVAMKKLWMASVLILVFCKKSDNTSAPAFPSGNFQGTSSFNANLSASEPFANYEIEYKNIRAVGAHGAQTAAPWASLNPTGSTYDLATITNPYFGLSQLSAYGYETIFLNIPIITVSSRSMPADIATLSFDDPLVKSRFHALIDVIQGQINNQVKYVALGNEVDTYLSAHPSEWAAYRILVEDARTYLKMIKPDVTVGVTTTFDGATTKFAAEVGGLNTSMDAIMLTYYPISSSFAPRDPGTVSADVAKMNVISMGKPVVMQEWGYPSSTTLGSSESKQATFIYNSLVELQKQGVNKFPFVSFFKYRDWTSNHVQTLTGQKAGQPFFEFMSSLGLKKNDGKPKEAFTVIQNWVRP
jgi:hypothetical protein